jgi:hypothetical protein
MVGVPAIISIAKWCCGSGTSVPSYLDIAELFQELHISYSGEHSHGSSNRILVLAVSSAVTRPRAGEDPI